MDGTSILQMARGAIMERADYEMSRIMANIADPNTKATGKRKLVISMTFVPDDDRQTIDVTVSAKSTLEPTSPVKTALYLADTDGGDITAVVCRSSSGTNRHLRRRNRCCSGAPHYQKRIRRSDDAQRSD